MLVVRILKPNILLYTTYFPLYIYLLLTIILIYVYICISIYTINYIYTL